MVQQQVAIILRPPPNISAGCDPVYDCTQGWILGEAKETVAPGPLLQRSPAPLSEFIT